MSGNAGTTILDSKNLMYDLVEFWKAEQRGKSHSEIIEFNYVWLTSGNDGSRDLYDRKKEAIEYSLTEGYLQRYFKIFGFGLGFPYVAHRMYKPTQKGIEAVLNTKAADESQTEKVGNPKVVGKEPRAVPATRTDVRERTDITGDFAKSVKKVPKTAAERAKDDEFIARIHRRNH